MKRPSFQFYPADLRANVKLRRCSWAARGVWVEIMCLFHDSDEYGLLRWKLEEIAQAVGCPKDLVCELVDKGVLKGSEKDGDKVSFSESFAQRNAPSISVVLIDEQPTPLWYSSRMVRDEYVRNKRGAFGVKSLENPNVPKKKDGNSERDKDGEKGIDKGTFSPSPSSSSSSSSSEDKKTLSSADDESLFNPPKKPKEPPIPYDEIFDLYNEIVADPFGRPAVKIRNDKRKQLIKKIWNIGTHTKGLDWWRSYFEITTKNEAWMNGRQHKDGYWEGANFDFLLREDNFLKVVE